MSGVVGTGGFGGGFALIIVCLPINHMGASLVGAYVGGCS